MGVPDSHGRLGLDRVGFVLGPALMVAWLALADGTRLRPEAHGLARRVALMLLSSPWAARSPARLLLTVGVGTTFVSMWVSNTATTAMMCPVVVGMIAVIGAAGPATAGGEPFARSRFATALLL